MMETETIRNLPCVTANSLSKVFPNAPLSYRNIVANDIQVYGQFFGIDTAEEVQQYLAQVGAETGGLTTLNVTENLNYSTASRLVTVWPSKFSLTGEPGKVDRTLYCTIHKHWLISFIAVEN